MERNGGRILSAWSRPPRRLIVVDSLCSHVNQVAKKSKSPNPALYNLRMMQVEASYMRNRCRAHQYFSTIVAFGSSLGRNL
jgi:hypothetical protein